MKPSPSSDQKAALEATAIRYLSYRPRFKAEVVNRLAKKAKEIGLADPDSLINQITESLEKSGFIDDAKNLESFIRYRLETKLKGPLYIKAQLIHLNLSRQAVQNALANFAPREVQLAAITRFIAKKSRGRLDQKTKARLFRALIARGFSASLIASAFDEGSNKAV